MSDKKTDQNEKKFWDKLTPQKSFIIEVDESFNDSMDGTCRFKNQRGDTFTIKSEEFSDFLHGAESKSDFTHHIISKKIKEIDDRIESHYESIESLGNTIIQEQLKVSIEESISELNWVKELLQQ